MKKHLTALVLCLFSLPLFSQSPEAMLSSLPQSKDYVQHRSSSYDRSGGNADARRVAPGETLTLLDEAGPGLISHIWVTIASDDPNHLKALVLRMLREVGVDSYHVIINTERGAVTPQTPAHNGFNHAILAIKLPEGLNDPSLVAVVQHPKLGRILFFDPTDEMTPFGQIRGSLQANYGLMVTPEDGELLALPQQPSAMNSIERTGRLKLDGNGNLIGDVHEVRLGERASSERWALRTVSKDTDRIKPIESLLANSLSNFNVTKATISNLAQTDQPFGFDYSFVSTGYAKNAGGLLLVRPRVLGNKGYSFLETKEARKFPIEFEGPARDTDIFEIVIPDGYVVDDIPAPVDADYGFASYHAKTEVKGNVIDYKRTYEVKELSVPVNRAEELRKFYRIIAGDERNTVVLKAASK